MFNKQWTTVASRKVLVDSVEFYRESFGHDRANVISTVVQKIEDLAERNGENVPANLQAVNRTNIKLLQRCSNIWLCTESHQLASESLAYGGSKC